MTLSGVFGICGIKNNNNRIYEAGNYSAMIKTLKERILKYGGIPGELEHPQTMNITLENISHKITDIDIDENGVVSGTIELLNTPKGKIAQAIVEGGLPLYISSRGSGRVAANGVVQLETLQTYDLVGSPGFSQAELRLNESTIRNALGIDTKQDLGLISDNIYYITEEETKKDSSNEKMNKLQRMTHYDPEYKSQLDKLRTEIENSLKTVDAAMAKLNSLSPGDTGAADLNPADPDFEMKDTAAAGLKASYTYNDNDSEETAVDDLNERIDNLNNLYNELYENYADLKSKINSIITGTPELLSSIGTGIENWFTEAIAPKIEEWVTEEYSSQLEDTVLSKMREDIETNIYSKIINEASQSIQNWIIEHYSNLTEKWLNEEFMGKIQENIDTAILESKKNSVDSIDATLKLLENYTAPKPAYGRVVEDTVKPRYIAEMPDAVKPSWNMASVETRENINRKAKLYNFNTPNAINEFWNSIDFSTAGATAPADNNTVFESYYDWVKSELTRNRKY